MAIELPNGIHVSIQWGMEGHYSNVAREGVDPRSPYASFEVAAVWPSGSWVALDPNGDDVVGYVSKPGVNRILQCLARLRPGEYPDRPVCGPILHEYDED